MFRTAVEVPAGELPSWAETGIVDPAGGHRVFGKHTLDLDAAELADGMPWPPITVMTFQVSGAPAGVLLEVGPGGLPHRIFASQARRIGGALRRRGRAGRRGERVTWPAEEDRTYAAEVGRRLRGWRVMRRLTQQQTADLAGVDRVVVLAAERGAVALDLTRLRRLAWAVGAPLPELVDEDRVLPRAAGSHSGPAPRRR